MINSVLKKQNTTTQYFLIVAFTLYTVYGSVQQEISRCAFSSKRAFFSDSLDDTAV